MNIYLVVILSVLIINYTLNMISEILNLKNLGPDLPSEFKGFYKPEKYRNSQEYLRITTRFEMISSTLMVLITILFILYGGFNLYDGFARGFGFAETATGLIFIGCILFSLNLLDIPFSIYRTFVIEEKYGFNRTTIRTFITDIFKTWLLTAIIGSMVLSMILWFFNKSGSLAWIYCWLAVTMFQIFFMFIAPVLIMPLFNKFIPLEPGELKTALENYTEKQNFKIKGVFTMDGSKRSSKSNAFFTGFGRFRRIVLFDTLIEKHSTEELVSITAHEIGHYKKKHILKHLIVSICSSGIMFYLMSFFINNRGLFDAFKMEHTSIYASLLFFGFLYAPFEMILGIFSNMFSRKNEFEADAYAISTYPVTGALITALKKLSIENLSNLTPHPFKVFLSYSHPPVLDRIRRMKDQENP